jgi:hypothetical protein
MDTFCCSEIRDQIIIPLKKFDQTIDCFQIGKILYIKDNNIFNKVVKVGCSLELMLMYMSMPIIINRIRYSTITLLVKLNIQIHFVFTFFNILKPFNFHDAIQFCEFQMALGFIVKILL